MKLSGDMAWPDVVEELLSFLRGAGYIIPYNCELEIKEDDDEADEED
jgi:hypothetical protein